MRWSVGIRHGVPVVFLALLLTGGTALAQFGTNGYITDWLILGPFSQTSSCPQPLDFMPQDFLTDGVVTQEEVCPSEGEEIATDCGGAAACTGYLGTGTPTWFAWRDPDGGIDLDDPAGPVFPGFDRNLSNAMSYAVTYVTAGEDMEVYFGIGSDDSFEVWFDDAIVQTIQRCAPWGWPNPQNVLGPVTLVGGVQHRIMTKCFEAGGEWRWYLRMQDVDGQPITDQTHAIEVTIDDIVKCGGTLPPTAKATRDLPDVRPTEAPALVTINVEEKLPEVTGKVVITETPPAGWTVSEITPAPKSSNVDIVWEVDGAALPVTLSYKVQAPPCGSGCFVGKIEWKDAGTDYKKGIGGEKCVGGGCFGQDGYITDWLILGPIGDQGGCDIGPAEIQADYLTDGVETQAEILPSPDMQIAIDFGSAENAGDQYYGRTVDDIPVWYAIYDNDGGIDYNDDHMVGMRNDNVMAYAICYVLNKTGADIENVWIATGSDDALEVWFDEQTWTMDTCRGWGWPTPQETNGPVTLRAGVQHRIMTKTFEQGGGWNFYLRFQDDFATPITDGLEISLKPTPLPANVVRDIKVDSFKFEPSVPVSLLVTADVTGTAVKIDEVLPSGTSATGISDGGKLTGSTIEWDLASVTAPKTLTYTLVVESTCAASLNYPVAKFFVEGRVGNIGGEKSVRREYVEGNPVGWKSEDIGTTGGATMPNGPREILIKAPGAGIRAANDEFRFIHRPASGDFDISCRIDCASDPSKQAQVGLVVRNSLQPNAAMLFFDYSTGATGANIGTFKGFSRKADGGSAVAFSIAAGNKDVAALPVYMRLTRQGTKLTLHRSPDGSTWTEVATKEIGASLGLGTDTFVGVAASAYGGKGGQYTVRELTPSEALPNFRRGDADASGKADLTDAVIILGYLFQGGVNPTCLDALDANDSGKLDLTDAVFLLAFLFQGGGDPPAPGPFKCGTDDTPSPNITAPCEYNPAKCQ